ncbi:PREDICTED: ribosomal protein L18-like [Elephantulus edwardii]|uniref:ribosomal protein L18-like n=1 Tax=Elephantulus edwardii TaxID=28737 RepID=UPI0003F05CB1|nr:PREDICTED: ribosomal protein L18-like [Elephantulus edwardii]
MGVDICHNNDRKGLSLGTQEQALLPQAVGQGLQVPGRTNQLHHKLILLKRLFMSHTNQLPLVSFSKPDSCGGQDYKVCYLQCEKQGQSGILKAGGKIFTFNQLVLDSSKGCGTVVLSGPHKGAEVYRHFRKVPGTLHSHTKLFPLQDPEL